MYSHLQELWNTCSQQLLEESKWSNSRRNRVHLTLLRGWNLGRRRLYLDGLITSSSDLGNESLGLTFWVFGGCVTDTEDGTYINSDGDDLCPKHADAPIQFKRVSHVWTDKQNDELHDWHAHNHVVKHVEKHVNSSCPFIHFVQHSKLHRNFICCMILRFYMPFIFGKFMIDLSKFAIDKRLDVDSRFLPN